MERLFLQLARMSLAAGWLVLVVLALRLLLKKAPRRLVCLLWALVAFRLVCPAQIEWRASLMPRPEAVVQTVREMPSLVLPAQEAPNIPPEQTEPTQPAAPTPAAPDLVTVLSRVWLAGVIAMLLWAGVSDLRLRRRLRVSVRLQNGVWLCDEIDTPFVLGLFAPRIYLPYGWDDEQNVYILAHERAHIVRGDNWWKLLGWLLLSVYWFHPLLWLAYVLFCRDLEFACDELAVRGLDRDGLAAYSQALLDCSSPRGNAFTFPVAFGEVGARPRIKAVLNCKKPAVWLVLAAVLALLAAAVFFLTDRPADADLETELVFRDVAEFPFQFDADSSRDLTYAEVQSILTGPDAALVLDSKRTDEFYAHALFSGNQTFSGVVLGRQNLSRRGSYMVLKEEISMIPGAVPITGESFQKTCTVRGAPVDAQRWQNNGYTWYMTDFVRRDSDEQAYAMHVGVLCVPSEGDKERDCIQRLYELVDGFLNPANKLSLDQIAAAFAEPDEMMEFLRIASVEQLINVFPRTDGAYTETLIAHLADAARESHENVMAQIDESALSEQEKETLKHSVEELLAQLDRDAPEQGGVTT